MLIPSSLQSDGGRLALMATEDHFKKLMKIIEKYEVEVSDPRVDVYTCADTKFIKEKVLVNYIPFQNYTRFWESVSSEEFLIVEFAYVK